mmetsp:Transcript_31238/g.56093  ORF Transcript_31238/g.56093 Transcript_31238/m.56093 type:complete len:81 (+) Transcript_31238:171-413(+)
MTPTSAGRYTPWWLPHLTLPIPQQKRTEFGVRARTASACTHTQASAGQQGLTGWWGWYSKATAREMGYEDATCKVRNVQG